MKVGTDSVLLGTWCPLDSNPFSVLDIGAGTGVLSLIIAQRSQAEKIDALEIDDDAYEQCVENFENSKWNDRLFCFHASLDEFVEEPDENYDLIICNPPFYSEDFKTDNKQRDLARFQDALPFYELVDSVNLLLSDNGIFCVIIPFKEENRFIDLCAKVELFPVKITRVRGCVNKPIIRTLLAFKKFELSTLIHDEIVIEIDRHVYTEEYINLTKDFYLKM